MRCSWLVYWFGCPAFGLGGPWLLSSQAVICWASPDWLVGISCSPAYKVVVADIGRFQWCALVAAAGVLSWPAGSLQIACAVGLALLGQVLMLALFFSSLCFAGSSGLAWASLMVVVGLCVHLRCEYLVPPQLCAICWCHGFLQFGWGSLPNCLDYRCISGVALLVCWFDWRILGNFSFFSSLLSAG